MLHSYLLLRHRHPNAAAITGNPSTYRRASPGTLRYLFQRYITCSIPSEKKSVVSISTHWHTSAFSQSSLQKCFPSMLFQWSEEKETARCKVRVIRMEKKTSQRSRPRSCIVTQAVLGWALSWRRIISSVSSPRRSPGQLPPGAAVLCNSDLHSLLPLVQKHRAFQNTVNTFLNVSSSAASSTEMNHGFLAASRHAKQHWRGGHTPHPPRKRSSRSYNLQKNYC
jgi:hypothetical protein